MARSIGWSIAIMAATERQLRLNLSGIRKSDKTLFLDAPVSPSGLFGTVIETVVSRFREVRMLP